MHCDEIGIYDPRNLIYKTKLHRFPIQYNTNLCFQLAEELAYTCYLTFARQPTFLAPEITHFNSAPSSTTDFYVKPADSHYLLRPETIESLWYLYYVTGNKTYQDWGWNIFQVSYKELPIHYVQNQKASVQMNEISKLAGLYISSS